MFGRSKKEIPEPKKVTDSKYTEWQADIGFLVLTMTRKKSITKNFFIDTLMIQLTGPTDYIRDEDLAEIIESSVEEVINELAPAYKTYLADKYFGSIEALIKFVTEDFFVDFSNAAILKNKEKVAKGLMTQRVKAVMDNNKKES